VVAAPPLPVEVRVDEQVVGVLIIKQVGPQILVRADDLPGSGLALPLTCAAGQYLSLLSELNPQLDTTTLMLRLGRNALQVQASEPDLPTPDSLQTTGSLSADSDTCLRVQLEADFDLIPAGVQGDLGAQAGSSLLGVSLRRGSASDSGPALRLESAAGGRYRVLFRGVMLRPRPAGPRAAPARCWAFRPPCS